MTGTLTTFELVEAVAPIVASPNKVTEVDVELTGRRIRYWTNTALLRPAAGTHIGKGRTRIYERSEVYIAAALMLLAEAVQGVEILTLAALHVRSLNGPEPLIAGEQYARWQQAIKGTERVFLFIGPGGRERSGQERFSIASLIPAKNLPQDMTSFVAGAFLDLTAAFRMIDL